MILKYGSYLFRANACKIASKSSVRTNAAGQQLSRKTILFVDGYLIASGVAAVTTAMTELYTALSIPFQDLIFYQDDAATTESATYLKNTNLSMTGVRITEGPNFPDSTGFDYTGGRRFTFTAESEYRIGPANRLISFHEELDFSGGGPLYIVRPAKRGPAQRQRPYQSTPYVLVQTGEAVGYGQYPPDPRIFFPTRLKMNPKIRLIGGNRVGLNRYEDFGKSWRIEYESESVLPALPTLWTG